MLAEQINRRNCLHSDSLKEHAETIISWEKLKPNENLLCLFYSDNQPFCGRGFLSDRNPGPLNRISILFPTPAQKLFVYIEGGKILKSDICFQFRHILGRHLESSFVAMVTFLFSALSWLKNISISNFILFFKRPNVTQENTELLKLLYKISHTNFNYLA